MQFELVQSPRISLTEVKRRRLAGYTGWWESEHGICGDDPANLARRFWRDLEQLFLEHTGRPPTQGEVADLIEFTTRGVFRPACGDANFPFRRATCYKNTTPKASKRVWQGIFRAGRPDRCMTNVDPKTGK